MTRSIYSFAERLMGMNDAVWARHANPWSVWTRMTCLPLLVLAIWSRVWLGWWSLIPILAALAWIWINPRAFPPVNNWQSWAAKATAGERVFLHHRETVATHHLPAANLLSLASGTGLPPLIYGLWVLDLGWTLAGLALIILPKLWFCDRMVWIYDDWLRAGRDHHDL